MKHFRFVDDMQIRGRWFLKGPLAVDGSRIDARLFTEGKRVDVRPHSLPFRKPGKPLEFTLADHAMPVANARTALILERLAPNDVQLLPIRVEGQSEEYFILNAIHIAACVDEKACAEVKFWTKDDFRPELEGTYKFIGGLRIDSSRTEGHTIFRIKDWEAALIVSETLKEAFEMERIIGAKFIPV